MATFLVGVSEARSLSRGSSTHLTAVSGIQAVSLFSRPPASSTSTRKSGSSKSRSRATPSRVSSSKKRTTTLAMQHLLYYPSYLHSPALAQRARRRGLELLGAFGSAPSDATGAFHAERDVFANGFGLGSAELARAARGEERNPLRVAQLTLAFGGDVLLFEPQAGAIEQRLDRAFGHLERVSDLAVAQVLQLAECEHQAVLLRQPLGDRPDLPAHLVRFLDQDGIEALARRRKVGEQLSLIGLHAIVGAQVALAAPQLVEAQVASHRMNPSAEVERVVDPVHHLQRFHEGLLRDVLGKQRISELAPDQAVDRR